MGVLDAWCPHLPTATTCNTRWKRRLQVGEEGGTTHEGAHGDGRSGHGTSSVAGGALSGARGSTRGRSGGRLRGRLGTGALSGLGATRLGGAGGLGSAGGSSSLGSGLGAGSSLGAQGGLDDGGIGAGGSGSNGGSRVGGGDALSGGRVMGGGAAPRGVGDGLLGGSVGVVGRGNAERRGVQNVGDGVGGGLETIVLVVDASVVRDDNIRWPRPGWRQG